jgi:signal transduction histidine kinase
MGEFRFPRGRRADMAVAAAAFAVDLGDLLIRTVNQVPSSRIVVAALGLAVGAATLLVRRRRPMVTLVVVVSADVLLGLLAGPQSGFVGTVSLVALYNAGRYLPVVEGWVTGGGAVLLLALPTVVQARFEAGFGQVGPDLLANYLFIVVGQLVGVRDELTRRDRAQAVAVAVHGERRRIARELHDVVAYHISVVNALVGAARTTMTRDPDRSREALTAAERTAREAMSEMRQMLAVLRAQDVGGIDPDESATADGVAALVRRAGETGVRASLEVTGDARPLPTAVDRAIYRVTQEALTNIRKYADGANVVVRLRYEPDAVGVEIVDDGPTRAIPSADSTPPDVGHGLVGLGERVALCGGTFLAERRPEGGFRVVVRIPLPMPAVASSHDAGSERTSDLAE